LSALKQRAVSAGVTIVTADIIGDVIVNGGDSSSSNSASTNARAADLIVTCGAIWSTEGSDRATLKVDQDAEIADTVSKAGSLFYLFYRRLCYARPGMAGGAAASAS
jgi:hypothetical protein